MQRLRSWMVPAGPASPVVYNVGELHQDNYGREGLAHVTVAGARHHGLRGVEVWLQTFAPGTGTPIHRHACEEVFVIQRGGGTARFRGPGGGLRMVEFKQNDTLFIRPNLVHQVRPTCACCLRWQGDSQVP
jgi:mannose-6-phosphate isomerase-like protein (cupin superfamily)